MMIKSDTHKATNMGSLHFNVKNRQLLFVIGFFSIMTISKLQFANIDITALLIMLGLITASITCLILKLDNLQAYMLYGFVALNIHQDNGMVMTHFEVFILISFCLLFKKKLVLVNVLVAAAIHHFLFFYLQKSGYPIYVLPKGELMISMVIHHCFYASVQTFALIYFCKTEQEKEQAITQYAKRTEQQKQQNEYVIDAVSATSHRLNDVAVSNTQTLSEITDQAETQSHQINQLTSAIIAMEKQVLQSSDNAHIASEAASTAKEFASQGMQIVSETHASIQSLVEDTHNVSAIIRRLDSTIENIDSIMNAIENIAGQTNLLALNAAIESARAGEQGRGFAVVADEVRTLASRTQQSAGEIKAMIEQLHRESKQSVELMNQSEHEATEVTEHFQQVDLALKHILDAINNLEQQNTQIAASGEEQNVVIQSIRQHASDISTAAQKTKNRVDAGSEQSRALADIAKTLLKTAQGAPDFQIKAG
ncbi:methyl-accepting chemotaxis protein [Photobacterium salinisoli]|uniref:methyl-accepting chemotaxis protein n=1 Tax=Photobacterium salinisoli TaxID=1616783 RepID=UPI000EA2E913|nr:methyl-accepting chemotaxis protein [Photobacterium salinisoli]